MEQRDSSDQDTDGAQPVTGVALVLPHYAPALVAMGCSPWPAG